MILEIVEFRKNTFSYLHTLQYLLWPAVSSWKLLRRMKATGQGWTYTSNPPQVAKRNWEVVLQLVWFWCKISHFTSPEAAHAALFTSALLLQSYSWCKPLASASKTIEDRKLLLLLFCLHIISLYSLSLCQISFLQ